MAVFYNAVEWLATFVEGLLVLYVSNEMCEKKYSQKKHYLLLLAFATAHTILIKSLNNIKLFSYATIIIALIYALIVSYILSSGSFVLHATSVMIPYFCTVSLDYVLAFLLVAIMGDSTNIFKGANLFFMNIGIERALYLIGDKLLLCLLAVAFGKYYKRIKNFDKRSLGLMLAVSISSFSAMTVLTTLILSADPTAMHISTFFAMFFIIIALFSTTMAVFLSEKYQNKKRETGILALTNAMMEKNFAELQESQNTIYQQVHDFKNHLRTIGGMVASQSEAADYIEDLLAGSYIQAQYCHSDNDVINSIINCKISMAQTQKIKFDYRVSLESQLNVSSVDICAILANQIDNAFEACVKITDESKRFTRVEIWQKESFVFFKVTNSADKNPFNKKNELISTKTDKDYLHGFGIKSINRSVSKYGGTLKNEYKDGNFISIAMVLNNE